MISLEKKEQKYDKGKHKKRIERIIENWDGIINIIKEEVPSHGELSKILELMDAPKTLEDMEMDASVLTMTIKTSKDIRDKYVLPKLLWDLGILDEIAERMAANNEHIN